MSSKKELSDILIFRIQAATGFLILCAISVILIANSDYAKSILEKVTGTARDAPVQKPKTEKAKEISGAYQEASSKKIYYLSETNNRITMSEQGPDETFINVAEGRRDGSLIILDFTSTLAAKEGANPKGLLELEIHSDTQTLTGVFKQNGTILQRVTLQWLAKTA